MKMIKWSIDYVETWILRVISRVIHATSENKMKETLTYYGFYGPNVLEDYMGHMLCLHKISWISEAICVLLISFYKKSTKCTQLSG
jgi:hypothetical protein